MFDLLSGVNLERLSTMQIDIAATTHDGRRSTAAAAGGGRLFVPPNQNINSEFNPGVNGPPDRVSKKPTDPLLPLRRG